ncbi:hypothetical protein GTQ99_00650 [Kineococcus sp. T13]|uniref:hypothetical protein n=1 Tax=Kineococcus vitellinus TaxID=2696565 RepID=UPI001411FAEA|nr:hypothetical protein [Kineococcus vitellinus]NAZ73941.1 hypothetical protein [Kineococcus vitellinus]
MTNDEAFDRWLLIDTDPRVKSTSLFDSLDAAQQDVENIFLPPYVTKDQQWHPAILRASYTIDTGEWSFIAEPLKPVPEYWVELPLTPSANAVYPLTAETVLRKDEPVVGAMFVREPNGTLRILSGDERAEALRTWDAMS